MKIKLFKYIVLITICILPAVYVFSDTSPSPLDGGTNIAPKLNYSDNKGLIMESEEVIIRLYDDYYADVEANFVMYNPTAKNVSMLVGFPFVLCSDAKNIRAFQYGREVKVFHYANFMNVEYPCWMVWDFGVDAKSRENIKVTYRVSLYGRSEPLNSLKELTDEAVKKNTFFRMKGDFREKILRRRVGYILETGALWSGVISKAVFRIYHVTKGSSVIREIVPSGYTGMIGDECKTWTDIDALWNGLNKQNRLAEKTEVGLDEKALTITFTDLKPKFNIDIIYNPALSYEDEIDYLKDLLEWDDFEMKPLVKDYISHMESFHKEKRIFPFKKKQS